MRESTKLLVAVFVTLILIGAYVSTRADPSLIIQDIGVSSPANGKPYLITIIPTSEVRTWVLKLTHIPTKEKITRTYTRAVGNQNESIALGANSPQATNVNVTIRWT